MHHGGDKYTGVDIKILIGNTDIIVDEVEKDWVEIDHPLKEASDGEIHDFCGHINRVLNMLDGMLSILRKKHGQVKDADYVAYEQSAEQAMLLWKELGLSYTPSFCYLHKRKLCVSWGCMEELESFWKIISSRATKRWTRFNNDLPTLALV
jgi:hypothetical protein